MNIEKSMKLFNKKLRLNTSITRGSFFQMGFAAVGTYLMNYYSKQSNKAEQNLFKTDNATPSCLDYGKSFICNTAEFNSVRMWIESRTTIIDEGSNNKTEYYQCGSCKSENTFASKNLFHKDNYDFLPIFGDGQVLVFRRHVDKRKDNYKHVEKMEDMWGADPDIRLKTPSKTKKLDSWKKISKATALGIPIVTQTEIHNPETGLKAIIECPCKTMNISKEQELYQVDTGPIALPDLSQKYSNQIESLRLAYIAFNTSDFADFVVQVPTPVFNKGKRVTTVYHYSELLTLSAKNRIIALGDI